MNHDHLDELLDAYLLDELAPDQFAQLQEALRNDPAARSRFVQTILIEAYLHRLSATEAASRPSCRPPVPETDAQSHRTAPRFARLRGPALAAIVLIAVGVAAMLYLTRQETGAGQDASTFARVVSGAVRVDGQLRDNIADGSTLSVTGNAKATIQLSDGSQATLDPATQLVVRGREEGARQVLHLTHGGGEFKVSRGGGQFRIDTPVGSVTVLGTQFTAVLRSPRTLFLSVADGTVRFDREGQEPAMLTAGQSRLFDGAAAANDALRPMAGVIQSVDLKAGEFVLSDDNKSTTTFRVGMKAGEREATFLLNGKTARFQDAIQRQRAASVMYVKVGDVLWASKVEVTSAAKQPDGMK